MRILKLRSSRLVKHGQECAFGLLLIARATEREIYLEEARGIIAAGRREFFVIRFEMGGQNNCRPITR